MKKLNKGFTSIELLVVIAIIGILSSIVLASLSTARSKGNDAKVQGQLAGFRNSAELYYGTANGYSDGTVVPATFAAGGMTIPSAAKDIFDNSTTLVAGYTGYNALSSAN